MKYEGRGQYKIILGSWHRIFLSSGLKYQEIVDNLQEQLSICLREKDHVDNLLQDALGECDRLRAVSEHGLQPLVDNLELQCSRKIESYGRSIAALNTEVSRSKLQINEKQQQQNVDVNADGGYLGVSM